MRQFDIQGFEVTTDRARAGRARAAREAEAQAAEAANIATVAALPGVAVGEFRLINLTPHEITLVGDGANVPVPPSGRLARAEAVRTQTGNVGPFPVYRTEMGKLGGLPRPVAGVLFVVSRIVAEAASDRDDLLFPDDTVRDEQGRAVGCRGFGTCYYRK